MVFVTVQDFHSMCQKHFHYLLKKRDCPSSSISSADTFLKASRSEVLSLFMRSTLLALLFLSFTWLSLLKYGTSATAPSKSVESDLPELLPLLLNDLEKEGLFKMGDKALFLSGGDDEVTVSSYSQTVIETDMVLVSASNQEMQSMVPDETFDFAFAHSRHIDSAEFIDRTLKVGGIFTVQLNLQDLPPNFLKHPNYEIVYVKSSEYTVMTMRKTGETEHKQSLVAPGRKLLGITEEEAREKALRKLEDVLLEPPRAASRKSRTYFKRTRYLPDLMGDNLDLESYSRRVFIDVGNGKGSSGMEWFVENYPTRNQKFEMYKIETVNDEMSLESEKMGMTEWLKENVKEEEYVVMKAEAEVVEEMMRSKSIKMVDELFLECKPKGLGLRGRKMQSKSGRAYWECLALYGKLRDEGVAVHQWWG
ncbi:unnamed protein product [Arabidopsis lyrata]|uniref:DUF7870 domain-containing protein n=1 Tax=Arabidopsis lyrata subsp. lyrata TaxID=81972 RepID=D7KY88_ARALL|nr:uncharacterized protein LOC9324296 [Arabidopsis lyrata subsp. lyrata]EFH62963.1 hypothetical protein ARALYDRAFT_475423 [Arabidopsis lyrata subsp. lyrata]CAH8256531.1 unnamed protein product [Arabidopsis lyrata]|eukprot:XP_002886704.1 uncharacterized protein LOC9324296 [Arabidopsis lyrata subsp. lyrata]